jgi:hypothetical protein
MSGLAQDEAREMLCAIRTAVSVSELKWILERIIAALQESPGP